jgi:hypothetical protein
MTAWTPIDPSTEFVVGKAITFEHGRLWFNNPIAIAEGADGAPRISRRAIQPGGAEIDGLFDDASTPPTAGFSELTGIALTTPKTFPFLSIIRVNGNVSLSSTLTISGATEAQRLAAQLAGAVAGFPGEANFAGGGTADGAAAGGGSIGAGGNGANGITQTSIGGIGRNAALLRRLWLSRIPILGGPGGNGSAIGGLGGGCLLLIVNGDCDFTGGTITANGVNGATGSSNGSGAGGGGSIIVICTGAITNGTFNARGGSATGVTGSRPGGGGGGYVALVASDFLGSQTISVAGGTATAPATIGAAGVAQTETLSEAEINGVLLR